MTQQSSLDRILQPLLRALTPEVAERISKAHADEKLQQQLDDLADRNNEGLLSPQELSEYQELVMACNIVSILQAEARSIVHGKSPA